MIEYLKEPYNEREIKAILHPIVKEWFFKSFKEFSLPQLYGVIPIHQKKNILVSAPTGATKTLTGFLAIINELIVMSRMNELEDKVYCVYISPLKALNYDIEINLSNPLKEIEEIAGKKFGIRIGVRTGDTSQAERSKMLRKSPHILITTPESFAILLTSSKFREKFRDIKWLIIDEIHALADNKRGVHLSLSIERLTKLNDSFSRVGLSATIAPLDKIAKYLVNDDGDCKIIDVQFIKKMDLNVLSPVDNLIDINYDEMHNKLYSLIDGLVQEHKTTLIFTNTRSATERVVNHLKEKFPSNYSENIGAHHGSLGKALRRKIEKKLREGKLKVVVTSTSLELGIDIGYIDLVILLGSPKSVARGLQRIGRSAHKLHEITKGRIIVLDRDDLIENSVLLKVAIEKKIDRIYIPENCLDVLAQQIYGIALSDRIHIDELFNLIKKSYCYRNLRREDFDEVINYLSGEYTSLEDRHVYAKIWHDKETGLIGRKGKMGKVIYMTNIGTIPDETRIKVKINDEVIGTIDEDFLERLRRGDVFVLGGEKYEFLYAKGSVAYVKASVYRPPTIPSWFSEMLPLSFDLAIEIGRFRMYMEERLKDDKSEEEILNFINEYLYVDKNAANAIYKYFKEQYDYMEIPNNKKIIIEHYTSEDKKYVVFHSLYGRRVNDALSRALAYVIAKIEHKDIEFGISDNGFYIASEKKIQVMNAFKILKSDELRNILENAIDKTEILRRRFRHCATRALMILRTYKGETKKVGRQQVSSMLLLNAVKKISNNFSILKEARREILEDLMDIENATNILKGIEDGKIKVVERFTSLPSPFAFNLVLQGYVDVFKIEDKIEFLRQMHQKILAKIGK